MRIFSSRPSRQCRRLPLGLLQNATASAKEDDQSKAVKALTSLGARVERDASAEGKPVVGLILFGGQVDDNQLPRHLSSLPDSSRCNSRVPVLPTQDSAHSTGLKKLKRLLLNGAPITDSGLSSHRGTEISGRTGSSRHRCHGQGACGSQRAKEPTSAQPPGNGHITARELHTLTTSQPLAATLTSASLPSATRVRGVWKRRNSLRRLRLASAKLTDAGLAGLAGLDKLKSLDLSTNKITDTGLSSLKKLAELESLTLADTVITDDGLRSLKRLPNLKSLDLSRTKVTGKTLELFKSLEELATIPRLTTRPWRTSRNWPGCES